MDKPAVETPGGRVAKRIEAGRLHDADVSTAFIPKIY